jgi:hypothetical protein
LLQTFLATALGSWDVLGPKGADGKFGKYTLAALKQWAQKNSVKANSVQELMQIALDKSGYKK